ncbi:MAG: Txe/YoeB family addiction module toxin [Chitinophagia bacterium]
MAWVPIFESVKIINNLLENILSEPFPGIGKPEPLKHELAGLWSRRINKEHRLIYRARKEIIEIVSLRFHYL